MHLHKNIYVKLQTKQTYKHTRGKCSNVYEHRNVSFKKQVYSSIVIVKTKPSLHQIGYQT